MTDLQIPVLLTQGKVLHTEEKPLIGNVTSSRKQEQGSKCLLYKQRMTLLGSFRHQFNDFH